MTRRCHVLVTVALLASSCQDDATSCPVGSEGCPCTVGGHCDGTLICASWLCVELDFDAGADAAADADAVADSAEDVETTEVDGPPGCGNLVCDPWEDCTMCAVDCSFRELCNERDDDCDTSTDEDFDLAGDRHHCGGCGVFCRFANAEALCAGGVCRLGDCRSDYYDANHAQEDGCEYRCIRVAATEDAAWMCSDLVDNDCDALIDAMDPDCECVPEVCNYFDDDCDDRIDEDFDLASDPANCGTCGLGCSGATPRCCAGTCCP